MWKHLRRSFGSRIGRYSVPGHAAGSWKRRAAIVSWAAMIAGCVQFSTVSLGQADTWRSDGNWVISGSPKLGGCTMATRYRNGAFLSISAVTSNDGRRIWEVLVSERGWNGIQSEIVYPVNLHFLGAAQSQRQLAMTGYRSYGAHSLVTNALVLDFTESSELMPFISEGLETARRIVLVLDGKLLGSYELEHARTAFRELNKCLDSGASNYEA